MKILFIAKGDLPDFQSDMVFHGLRSLYGADCVDLHKIWHMYKKDKAEFWNQRVPENGKSYGRGFTLYGTLDDIDDSLRDTRDLYDKIRDKYFDYVVYGSATRCQDFLPEVLKVYNKGRVIFVDGEDNQQINYQFIDAGGHLFKRELISSETSRLHPINFCIPEEKIVSDVPEKSQNWATCKPGDLSTYIFDDEKSYYEDYQKSYFGVTIKKGGYDALRHYEVLLNGTIPYFPGLEECPPETMMGFPKEEVIKAKAVVDSGKIEMGWYKDTVRFLLDHTRKHLTTKAVVTKMMETIAM
jgi:hypothetical protein